MSDTENTGSVAVSDPESEDQAKTAKMDLRVDIADAGPCRKRISVVVPEAEITTIRNGTLDEFASKASVPGFRVGRVPRDLVKSRFRQELADELKQRVLVQSLEQLTEEFEIDPINEPDMDVETLEIPDSGDFEYAFDVEVRPDVQLPDFADLTLKRPSREVSDADVQNYIDRMLFEYGEKIDHEDGAAVGDFVSMSVDFVYEGQTVREIADISVRVQPVLRFKDAEIADFGGALTGVKSGESREIEFAISAEAAYVPMRGEKLKAVCLVSSVQKLEIPPLDHDLLDRIGVESVDKLRQEVKDILDRQVTYRQRQSAREQLLEIIGESSSWDLPEELVLKQVENALHREILEMQQAGYTSKEIRARENDLRQHSVSITRKAMKEHFILDSIATAEEIEVSPQDIELEIMMMAFQSGETPRRLRARLVKTGVIENLEAQIRERKAVDVALDKAKYEEVPMDEELIGDDDVEAVDDAICNVMFARASAATAKSAKQSST
ncbi:MAG: trigger factor [Planctomycetota bacterium]|nr:trigger factor [Planctomycetota bacterium]